MKILTPEKQKCFSYWGLLPPDPLSGLCPWTPLEDFHPQTPYIVQFYKILKKALLDLAA